MSNSIDLDLIQMRKHVLEAEEALLKAKDIANKHGFTFTIANSTYVGATETWIDGSEKDSYWNASGMQNC